MFHIKLKSVSLSAIQEGSSSGEVSVRCCYDYLFYDYHYSYYAGFLQGPKKLLKFEKLTMKLTELKHKIVKQTKAEQDASTGQLFTQEKIF